MGKKCYDWNKLNCMNYQVNEFPLGDRWYIQTGMRGLWNFCKLHDYNFRQIIVGLNYEGQWIGSNHTLTMI